MGEEITFTPKQQRFIEEYLVDLNATQAAIRAGYSAKTAAEQASRLLTNVKVAAAVAEARAALTARTEITQDTVLKGFYREANYFGDGASHSARVSAFGGLAKVLGLETQKHEHAGPGGGAIPNKYTIEFVNAASQSQPEAGTAPRKIETD